jgi:hypothetical protein
VITFLGGIAKPYLSRASDRPIGQSKKQGVRNVRSSATKTMA